MLVGYQILTTFILLLLFVNAMFPSELSQYLVNLASKRTLSGAYKNQPNLVNLASKSSKPCCFLVKIPTLQWRAVHRKEDTG